MTERLKCRGFREAIKCAMPDSLHWLLAYTKPRAEKLAEENLLRQGFEVFASTPNNPIFSRSGAIFSRLIAHRCRDGRGAQALKCASEESQNHKLYIGNHHHK
jgi:hypothetical protein